jgi:hypothetical protein
MVAASVVSYSGGWRVAASGVLHFLFKHSSTDRIRADALSSSGRELWRLHGPARVVSAALYPHTDGIELRVFFEPEHKSEALSCEVGDLPALERRAAVLRQQLLDQGWVQLETTGGNQTDKPTGSRTKGTIATLAILTGGLAFWSWRRRRATAAPPAATDERPA